MENNGSREIVLIENICRISAGGAEIMNGKNDANIKYWIFELNMPAQVKACIDAISKATGRSSDELFQKTIRENLKQFEEDPVAYRKSIRKFIEEERQHPLGIEVIRCYPVYVGETEEEAQERYLTREPS